MSGNKGKPIHKSKTVWANSVALILTITASIVKGEATPEEIGILVLTIANLLLRFVTKEPIRL